MEATHACKAFPPPALKSSFVNMTGQPCYFSICCGERRGITWNTRDNAMPPLASLGFSVFRCLPEIHTERFYSVYKDNTQTENPSVKLSI